MRLDKPLERSAAEAWSEQIPHAIDISMATSRSLLFEGCIC